MNLYLCIHIWQPCISHLKVIGPLVYSDIPNDNTLHSTISKVTFITVTTDLIRKISKNWDVVKFTVVDASFQNFSYAQKPEILSLANITISYFSWCIRLTSFPSEKVFAAYSSLNNHSLLVPLQNKNSAQKSTSSLQFRKLHTCIFLRRRSLIIKVYSTSALWVVSILSCRIVLKRRHFIQVKV